MEHISYVVQGVIHSVKKQSGLIRNKSNSW